MFLSNKYTKWYYAIITNAKNECRQKTDDLYLELHHIIPRSLGGSNFKENVVLLTAREHFICHCLLIKMCENSLEKRKMSLAFYKMARSNNSKQISRIGNGKLYEKIKKSVSYLNSGSNNYFYHNKFIGENNSMKKPEVKAKHLTIMQSDLIRMKISESVKGEKNPFYGKSHSLESRKKISESRKKYQGINHPFYGKKHKRTCCEFCNKIISIPMYKRWHGENCKKHKKNSN